MTADLFRAAKNGDLSTLAALLGGGADPNTTNADQWTPLHTAAFFAQEEVAELLLNRGAVVNAQNKDGWTALHFASCRGHEQLARLLLGAGAGVMVRNKDGLTPLRQLRFQGGASAEAFVHLPREFLRATAVSLSGDGEELVNQLQHAQVLGTHELTNAFEDLHELCESLTDKASVRQAWGELGLRCLCTRDSTARIAGLDLLQKLCSQCDLPLGLAPLVETAWGRIRKTLLFTEVSELATALENLALTESDELIRMLRMLCHMFHGLENAQIHQVAELWVSVALGCLRCTDNFHFRKFGFELIQEAMLQGQHIRQLGEDLKAILLSTLDPFLTALFGESFCDPELINLHPEWLVQEYYKHFCYEVADTDLMKYLVDAAVHDWGASDAATDLILRITEVNISIESLNSLCSLFTQVTSDKSTAARGNQLVLTWIDKTRHKKWVMSVQERVLNLLWTMLLTKSFDSEDVTRKVLEYFKNQFGNIRRYVTTWEDHPNQTDKEVVARNCVRQYAKECLSEIRRSAGLAMIEEGEVASGLTPAEVRSRAAQSAGLLQLVLELVDTLRPDVLSELCEGDEEGLMQSVVDELCSSCSFEDVDHEAVSSRLQLLSALSSYLYPTRPLPAAWIARIRSECESSHRQVVLKWALARDILDAASSGDLDRVSSLLDEGARVNTKSFDEWTPLHLASQGGHEPVVQALVSRGAAINARNKAGWTALHFAATNGHAPVVQVLIAHGATVNVKTKAKRTPLHMSAEGGHLHVAQLLVEHKASVGSLDDANRTPYHCAAAGGHAQIVDLLLAQGAELERRKPDGQTMLALAAKFGHDAVVDLLLARHSQVNTTDEAGRSPLHEAAESGHDQVTGLLLDHDANVNLQSNSGCTAALLAANNNHEAVLQILISHGADVNLQNEIHTSPLHAAAADGYKSVVQLLLTAGADILARNQNGMIALHDAVAGGHDVVIQLLITAGCNVNAQDHDLDTPLFLAARAEQPTAARLLIGHGAKVNARNDVDDTPLHGAATNKDSDLVTLLMHHGAHVNGVNKAGLTPLSLAAGSGALTVAEQLLAGGAHVDAKRKDGRSALHLASAEGHTALVALLLGHNADVNCADNAGVTPCHLAAEEGRTDVLRLLLKHGGSVGAQDQGGRMPLHLAAVFGHMDAVQALLSTGAAVSAVTQDGLTALSLAAERNHTLVCERLCREGGLDLLNVSVVPNGVRRKLVTWAAAVVAKRTLFEQVVLFGMHRSSGSPHLRLMGGGNVQAAARRLVGEFLDVELDGRAMRRVRDLLPVLRL